VTRILVVEHEAGCPPAHVATWLTDAGAELDVCRPWAGDEVPAVATYDAVVVLGGSMGANDDALHWWLAPVKQLIVDAVEQDVPTLGICLGHQLMGLATGHETTKLPFGHRGANHPVLDRRTGRVLVTSQNHGFAVVPSERAEATHVSLYDGTVEGFDFPELRAQSVQFHPEAGPGPHDAWPILERWVDALEAR
jgi:carbamoyl-phosphate synthase small subunit